jgi:hypothetical protein
MQFSLKWLAGAVALIALAIAGLINASPWWSAILGALLGLALLFILVGTLYGISTTRAFCAGFSIVTAGYALLTFGSERVREHMSTDALAERMHAIFKRTTSYPQNPGLPASISRDGTYDIYVSGGYQVTFPSRSQFKIVAHQLVCLLASIIGGGIAVTLWKKRDSNLRSPHGVPKQDKP